MVQNAPTKIPLLMSVEEKFLGVFMLNNVSDISKLIKKLQKLRPVNIITSRSRVAKRRVIFGKFKTLILSGKYSKFG